MPPGIGPDAAVEKVLAFLGEDQYLTARELAREALRRFPDHARVQKLYSVFDPHGKAVIRSGGPRQPNREKEFAWLRHPPEWARGMWVALVGSEVIAADKDLGEVERVLQSKDFSRRPLVHHIE